MPRRAIDVPRGVRRPRLFCGCVQAVDQLANTLLMFDAFYDVEAKAKDGNEAAKVRAPPPPPPA